MPIWEYAASQVELDEEGYLVRFEDWNEKVACGLAEKEGIWIHASNGGAHGNPLFPAGLLPQVPVFPPGEGSLQECPSIPRCEYELFMDPLKAWKIAGLPNPPAKSSAIYNIK